MKINITAPSDYTYNRMIKMTQIYMVGKYNRNSMNTVFAGKNTGYYAWIKRGGIQIEVINKTKENIIEIQNYLDFLFCQKYIGVSFEGIENIDLELKNIQCFRV